ncbi:glycosyltransferase family 2 protein [Gelidibacter gilvus]|uniref:Glycosyltransferase family 2 protein n=1 Tax=Gelidibacter gilvus TaxID=59602 RepID=A0A4Q0XDH6_9FLAO|nr:glycosyltransferase family 2 protein [Gelidibacter gilvus]RXJ45400.1 glycosyltransferase family 2 protein [Gelidibacter gilvus]
MKTPLISIIMPTYDRGDLISESIDAIINQSYNNLEFIIVDDGSKDDTINVVTEYTQADKRIKFFERPKNRPKGANACRNYGLELSTGDFIIWADSDDIMHPKCLEICFRLINEHSSDFCRFSKAVFFGSNHNYLISEPVVNAVIPLDIDNLYDMISNTIPFNTCTVLWNREVIGKERFSEVILYGDEWEFFSRLLSNGLEGISIDSVLYYVRKHENSTTGEFWSNDKIRRNSKVKANELVIENLKDKDLLNYKMARYFIGSSLFLKDKKVYSVLIENIEHLGFIQKMKLNIRYHFNFLIRPLYKAKRAVIKKIGRNNE